MADTPAPEWWFYHLSRTTLEQAAAPLMAKCLEAGWRVLAVSPSAERRAALDAALWTYEDKSFLPHGQAEAPGLDAAREATDAPVIGIAEAAFHAASLLCTGFSVVTTMTRTCVTAEHLLHRYGLERRCRGVHGTDIPVLELEHAGEPLVARIEAAARAALARDRSGAIVLGCAGMAPLCATLSARLGVPVIDGVSVAVKMAEALVALGLRTSKHGDYAPPPTKAWTGWAKTLEG